MLIYDHVFGRSLKDRLYGTYFLSERYKPIRKLYQRWFLFSFAGPNAQYSELNWKRKAENSYRRRLGYVFLFQWYKR